MLIPPIPMGLLNAAVNAAVWLVNGFCFAITAHIYQRLSSFQLETTGKTRATDASEVVPHAWIFGHLWNRRVLPDSWVIVMLALNFALFPLEILLEAGAHEYHRCAPISISSKGVCASQWKGSSNYGISAMALMTQRLDWDDKDWEFVLVGSKKSLLTSEVRMIKNLRRRVERKYVIRQCRVNIGGCETAECGNFTVKVCDKEDSNDVIKGWSRGPTLVNLNCTNDITFDKVNGIAYLFWGDGNRLDATRAQYLGSFIRIRGVEMIFTEFELRRIQKAKVMKVWNIPVVAKRMRTYEISCRTDGLLADDLAKAISLYRTAQMEASELNRHTVRDKLDRLLPLNASDVVKAAFALKAEDLSDSCTGTIDTYRKCGSFKLVFLVPFFILASLIASGWVVVSCAMRKYLTNVPVDTDAWRFNVMRTIERKTRRAELVTISEDQLRRIDSGEVQQRLGHSEDQQHRIGSSEVLQRFSHSFPRNT